MIFFDDTFPNKNKTLRNQTLNWSGSDTYKTYQKYQPNPYTKDDITYKFNNYGFRCDDFIPSDHRLVFLGCSVTEGIGLPLEETFSYQIYNYVKKEIKKDFPYWNLGLGGCGLDSIIRCYNNFSTMLRPQVVIALFPSYRLEYFSEISDKWYAVLPNNDEEKIFLKNPFLLNSEIITYSIEKNLVMLDLLLERYSSMLIWDKWDDEGFKKVNVSNLRNLQNYVDAWYPAIKNTLNDVKARDGKHHGKNTHKEFAKIILDQYGDEICDRLINGAP